MTETTRTDAQILTDDMRTFWDGSDPWGSVMAASFAVADALYWLDPNMVPADWQYRPGGSGEINIMHEDHETARRYLESIGVDIFDPYGEGSNGADAEDALREVGGVLLRLRSLYRSQGLDY